MEQMEGTWSAELATMLQGQGGDEEAPVEKSASRCSRAAFAGGASLVASLLIAVVVLLTGAAFGNRTGKDSSRLHARKLFADRLAAVAFTSSPLGGNIPIFKASPGLSESGYMLKGVPGMWTRNVAYTDLSLEEHDSDVRHREAFQALAEKDPRQIVVLLDGDIYSGGCPESVLRRRYELTTRTAGARLVLGADAIQRASMLDLSQRLSSTPRLDVRDDVLRAFELEEDAMAKYIMVDTTLTSNGPAEYIYPNGGLLMGPVADVLEFLDCVLGAGAASGQGYSRELGMTVCFLISKSKVTLDYTGGLLLSTAHLNLDELMVIKSDALDHAMLHGPLCFIESGDRNQNPWAGGLMDAARRFKAWPGAEHPSFGAIPLNVFVTAPFGSLEGELGDVWRENMAHLPPSTKLTFFNDAEMTQSVREISAELNAAGVTDGAFEAYSGLRPMAYRVDLWRCMVLWRYGGIYMDHKIKLLEDMWNYIDFSVTGTVWLVQDRGVGAFWNAFMVGPPRHPVWELVIKRIVENVRFRVYDKDPLHVNGRFDTSPLTVSGPIAVAWALGEYGIRGDQDNWSFEGFHNLPKWRSPRIFARLGVDTSGIPWVDGLYTFGANSHRICLNVPSLHSQTNSAYATLFHNYQAYCADTDQLPCPPV